MRPILRSVLVVLFIISCQFSSNVYAETSNSGGPHTPSGIIGPCRDDSDCPSLYLCVNNVCTGNVSLTDCNLVGRYYRETCRDPYPESCDDHEVPVTISKVDGGSFRCCCSKPAAVQDE